MRDIITTFLIALILGGGMSWWLKPAEVIDRTNYQQERIDSLTTVIRNRQATAQSLKDSLENTSEAFQQYVDEHQGQVSTLTTMRGRLKTKVDQLEDSLQSAQQDYDISFLCTDRAVDSTFVYSRTFNNELFEVRSYNHFSNDTFQDSLSLEALRDIRIDLALLVSEDRRTVESIATSEDIDSLKVSAQTEIQPPEDNLPWPVYVAVGAGLIKIAEFFLK